LLFLLYNAEADKVVYSRLLLPSAELFSIFPAFSRTNHCIDSLGKEGLVYRGV
jgi:hypothetical protein